MPKPDPRTAVGAAVISSFQSRRGLVRVGYVVCIAGRVTITAAEEIPRINAIVSCYNNPFLASSIFLAASPTL